MDIKKVSIAILFLISTITMFSQNCSKFYPFSKGTTMQITSYEKNQKVAAIIEYTVENVSNVSGTEVATMNTVIKDQKGKLIMKTNYEMSCSNDHVSIDFKSMMNPHNEAVQRYGHRSYRNQFSSTK